jgi:hypothetical protein
VELARRPTAATQSPQDGILDRLSSLLQTRATVMISGLAA